ncbi:MAG: FHA domain-containing protein [Microbacteriaceae bacterium]|nr:FHA domain-containing protein [Microbacteriaceae bacterium]
MSELTFLILRFAFVALLWIFILSIMYALRSNLFGIPARKMKRSPGDTGETPAVNIMPAAAPVAAPVVTPAQTGPSPANQTAQTELNDLFGGLPSAGSTGPARKLVITSGVANGTELELDEDYFTIGRSSDSSLVIVDEYTSTHHAKLQRTGNGWTITDLDSTNGTKVDGRPLTGTAPLSVFVPVTIGTTTFELRP